MIELTPRQFHTLHPIFSKTRFGVLSAGTLEGGHHGRVFANDPVKPTTGLVCTRAGYYFLAGEPWADDAAQIVRKLFMEDLAPKQMKTLGQGEVLIFYEPDEWKHRLFDVFSEHKPILVHKRRMVLGKEARDRYYSLNWQNQIPEGMHLVPVTADLFSQYPNETQTAQLFWGSIQRFVEKSLGFWLIDGSTIASSCEVIFIGGGEAEISISTAMEYRRQGLARLTASALITACLQRGLSPIWGCWPENEASVSLAKNLGFEDDIEQNACLVEFSRQ